MKNRKSKMRIYITIVLFLVAGLVGTNYYWYKAFHREKEKLKHAIIPTLSNDYYSQQLALTNYTKLYVEGYTGEIPSFENVYLEAYKVSNQEKKDVPLIKQNPSYPNGCEATSATMLLNYYGIDITLKEFIDTYLNKGNVYEKNGIRYGPDPSQYYAGSPSDEKRGWGCFDKVIEEALIRTIYMYSKENSSIDFHVILPTSKKPLQEVAFVAPAIIWVTIDYEEVTEVYEWQSYDKKKTFTYPKNSHAVVLTGYDSTYYYINDPLKSEKNIPVLKEKLEKSYDSLGRQTIYLESHKEVIFES